MSRLMKCFMPLFALLLTASAWAEDFVLVRDGKAAATVVPGGKKCEKWAAELVNYSLAEILIVTIHTVKSIMAFAFA